MKRGLLFLAAFLILGMLLAPSGVAAIPGASSTALQASGDENWDPIFASPGITNFEGNNSVQAMTVDHVNNRLYIGGSFTEAGGVAARNAAVWDGLRWSALGAGPATPVSDLAVDSKGIVYAAAPSYYLPPEGYKSYVYRWDGATWQTIASTSQYEFKSVAVDSNGSLFVGGKFINAGEFTGRYLARWDGASWTDLGGLFESGDIFDLQVDESDNLYIAGEFVLRLAPDLPACARVAYRNPSGSFGCLDYNFFDAGQPYGGDMGPVVSLAPGPNGRIAAADHRIGYSRDDLILELNGQTWTPLTPVKPAEDTYARFKSVVYGADGSLYVGGEFYKIADLSIRGIARWDGTQWTAPGGGIERVYTEGTSVFALAKDGNGNVYAGGIFALTGGVVVRDIARWDGSHWSGLGPGAGGVGDGDNEVYAIALDPSGQPYIGGNFIYPADMHATLNGVAHWSGTRWEPLGSGLEGVGVEGVDSVVHALAVDPAGYLYAGGVFTQIGGVSALNIARWDGKAWSPVGGGLDGAVKALAVDRDGLLYAGGLFKHAGGEYTPALARWDGSAWEALPSMNPFCPVGSCGVNALAFSPSGNLYFAGVFVLNGIWEQVAVWDQDLYTPINGCPVTAVSLATDRDGYLYAGGTGNSTNITMWDPYQRNWSTPGSGLDGDVYALVADENGDIYAGGRFDNSGTTPVQAIARYNGASWSPLGQGVNFSVRALTLHDNQLNVGGSFRQAGPYFAWNIARWNTAPNPRVQVNHDTGKPGSVFSFSATGFPANSTARLSANGRELSNSLVTDATGGLTVQLSTDPSAVPGRYTISLSVNPSASTSIILDSSAPLYPSEGSGTLFQLPVDVLPARMLYLSLVKKSN
ncbi:MAG: hypothetical protein EHM70_10730 [Chloroflexota bacterium]|nr:MAG: hypothetical protein EHM70_10730 [Chloroflexota bacterium]